MHTVKTQIHKPIYLKKESTQDIFLWSGKYVFVAFHYLFYNTDFF